MIAVIGAEKQQECSSDRCHRKNSPTAKRGFATATQLRAENFTERPEKCWILGKTIAGLATRFTTSEKRVSP